MHLPLMARELGVSDSVMAELAQDHPPDVLARTFAAVRLAHADGLRDPVVAALWTVALLYGSLRPPTSLALTALHTPHPHALNDLVGSMKWARTWIAWRQNPRKLSDALMLLPPHVFAHAAPDVRRTLLDLARDDPHAAKNLGFCFNARLDWMPNVIAQDVQATLMAAYLMGHHGRWVKTVTSDPMAAADYADVLGRQQFDALPASDRQEVLHAILSHPDAIVQTAHVIGMRLDALRIVLDTQNARTIASYLAATQLTSDDWRHIDPVTRTMAVQALAEFPDAIRATAHALRHDPLFWRMVAVHPRRLAAALVGLDREGWHALSDEERVWVIQFAARDAEAAALLASVAGHQALLCDAAAADPHALAQYVRVIRDDWRIVTQRQRRMVIRVLARDPDALAMAFSVVRSEPLAWQSLSAAAMVALARDETTWTSLSAPEQERLMARLASAPDVSRDMLETVAPIVGFWHRLWRTAQRIEGAAEAYVARAWCSDRDPRLDRRTREALLDVVAPTHERIIGAPHARRALPAHAGVKRR